MDGLTGFDALMPRQIANRAEDVGVAKANQDALTTVVLAILAGAFIALGAVFSTVTSTEASALPFGAGRAAAGLAFSLGLVLVVVAGAELFTGNNLLVIAYASRKITAGRVVRNWALVYVGNFIGAGATAAGMYAAGLHTLAGGHVGRTALAVAEGKCALHGTEALVRGVFCNALVCMAGWMCMSCRTTGDKILAIVLPITAFVAAGFEHSVANMYFIPAALLIKDLAPAEYWESISAAPGAFPNLEWEGLLTNLVPVTIGNVVGGSVLVGAVYWFVYCRGRGQAGSRPG